MTSQQSRLVRGAFILLAGVLLSGCGTPYGHTGSMGGVKVFELSPRKVEIMALGPHQAKYDMLAAMWKRKADEVARMRGVKEYEIRSFSTGREFLGVEVIGEGSFLERYADDMVFWLPKIARGVIVIEDGSTRNTAIGRHTVD